MSQSTLLYLFSGKIVLTTFFLWLYFVVGRATSVTARRTRFIFWTFPLVILLVTFLTFLVL